jgi:hypothetical protein
MVWLLARRAEKYVQGIADNFCNRTIVNEYDICHARDIFVEKRPKRVRLKCLHECGEVGDVGEQRCDLTTLPAKINRVRIAGKPFGQIGREVPRERCMRPFRFRLAPPCLAQNSDMPNGLGDCRLEIRKIDGLGDEIECTSIHRGANIGRVSIGRDDDGRELFFVLLQLLQE